MAVEWSDEVAPWERKRPWFVKGPLLIRRYDGVEDDLLTGGAGRSGLARMGAADLARFADPARPTATELRRVSIWASHLGLIDRTGGGGYGRLFGPGVGEGFTDEDGRVAGEEATAFAAAPGGGPDDVVTMVLQIPASFSPERPIIVAAPSSGSRGVYGAVAPIGELALPRGFAVVYTDKGTGSGVHDLDRNLATTITGEWADADVLGGAAHFRAPLGAAERAAFLAARPHRVAIKHAHSMRNPEAHWGEDTLRAIRFAFWVLNLRYPASADAPPRIRRADALVIAAGVSNGGSAALRAAERDWEGLIDGVVASEPAVQPRRGRPFSIVQGARVWGPEEHSRPLLEYQTAINLYQPCASLAFGPAASAGRAIPDDAAGGPRRTPASPERAWRMQAEGMLEGGDAATLGAAAQAILNDRFGLLIEQNAIQPFQQMFSIALAISVAYANAYGRFSVVDGLAGYSVAAIGSDGAPAPLPWVELATLPAVCFGIAPTGGLMLINDRIDRGREDGSSTPDQNFDGALALFRLANGVDASTEEPPSGAEARQRRRIRRGVDEALAAGDLQGIPAVIVNGRADAIVAPNHASRGYYGLNQSIEGEASRLRYYEVVHAQHVDAWNGLIPAFAERFVPLHFYLREAFHLMLRHLRDGEPLPPSQVVRAKPRGPGAPPIETGRHLPPIAFDTRPEDRIVFETDTLTIPE